MWYTFTIKAKRSTSRSGTRPQRSGDFCYRDRRIVHIGHMSCSWRWDEKRKKGRFLCAFFVVYDAKYNEVDVVLSGYIKKLNNKICCGFDLYEKFHIGI